MVSYVTSSFLGRAVHFDCGISWVSLLVFLNQQSNFLGFLSFLFCSDDYGFIIAPDKALFFLLLLFFIFLYKKHIIYMYWHSNSVGRVLAW